MIATVTPAERGDDEFVFSLPPSWIDLSSDDKAASAPLTLLRQTTAEVPPPRFFAIAPPPARAVITVAVGLGVLPIVPNTPDQLRLSMPSSWQFVRSDIVTLSNTRVVRLELDDEDVRSTWFYVPGRVRTATIRCECLRAEIERYAPLFEAFATTAAHGAETAPEVWDEVERARDDDPRRQGFRAKIAASIVGGVAIALAIGIPLHVDFEITLAGGAVLGIVIALVWAMRGGAPMLPGGDGESDD